MSVAVHIRKEAFLTILWTAVETFKKECLGAILGYTPSPKKDYFLITDAIPFQGIKKRLNTQVTQSERSNARWNEFWYKISTHPQRLGIFHSHPEWGPHQPLPIMSAYDIEDMQKQKNPLEIIVCISSYKKRGFIPWELLEDGSVQGSLATFNFRVNAFIPDEGEGKKDPTRIQIVTPTALRKLCRAQNKKNI